MVAHVVRIGALILLITVCRFLPFSPGGYDRFAVALSEMALLVGLASLLLVPIGALWLLVRSRGYYFAVAALVVSSIIAAFVSLGLFHLVGASFGFVVLALCAYGLTRMARRVAGLKNAEAAGFNPTPLYLLLVPTVVTLTHFSLIGAATAFSRDYAMARSAALISDIEAYRNANGQYPTSLLALHNDYKPSVIGIARFQYERNGEAYNIYFEQLSVPLGTQEIVMYNKLDEHAFAAHDSDILRWTPEQLRARRGWYAVHDASRPHWKYFWFD